MYYVEQGALQVVGSDLRMRGFTYWEAVYACSSVRDSRLLTRFVGYCHEVDLRGSDLGLEQGVAMRAS